MSLPKPKTTRRLSYAEAKAEALSKAMARDDRIHLIGGGFFGLSPHRALFREIAARYSDRVFSPPISELGFAGLAVGAAMAGLRPVVDFSTASFIFEAWPQIVNEAANVHYMSGGQSRAPVVFHVFHGLRGGGGPQHSHSPQAMLWNCPGIEIVLPSSPRDVRGLLAAAIQSDNPTLFVDHIQLLEIKGEVPDGEEVIPLGQADVKRRGDDVTIVATSLMVQHCLRVADDLAREGVQAEIIDPRTLAPFDSSTLMASVEKTGRVVVVDEGHLSCGVAAEISARIGETGFDKLKAPIRRVTTLDVPVPYSAPLEEFVSPSENRIADAVRAVIS
jgi:pyruvate/2-oxoglutarate/acetoin dehydrogenase E1 component